MKAFFLIFFSTLFLFSCKKEASVAADSSVVISKRLSYQEDNSTLKISAGQFNYNIEKSKLPYKKVVFLNASLLGYISELNLEEKVIGVSSPEYIYSDKITQLIQSKKIENVGNEQKYDLEKLVSLNPDVIFTNYVPSFENTYDILKKNGITIVFLDEYMEQDPLAKSKYLLLFGKLLGAESMAESRYKAIESTYQLYKMEALKAKEKPVVLCNEMYGSQWFLPGGKMATALLIKDANAQYVLSDNSDITAKALSFEEVFARSASAQYWINLSAHQSKKELLSLNQNYAKLKVFNQGKLYMINNREKGLANDYFQSGIVRADLLLKDYIKIFHPELYPNEGLYYLKELK